MSDDGWPYHVPVRMGLSNPEFREWLYSCGLSRYTDYITRDGVNYVTVFCFRDPAKATMVKLAWGGK